jgi:sterol desaturase/sphingolipid hydroxylase (fatty acid hydroxylase superfamily)
MSLITFVFKVIWLFAEPLLWPALAFALLAFAMKGRGAIQAARRAASETRTTLALYLFDFFLVFPPLGIAIALITSTVHRYSLNVVSDETWSTMGAPLTLILAVVAGDFCSYWRHRLEHTRWLWPAHAIHHSDTEMTWLTGNRFHPVNNLTTTLIDNTFLALLGFPAWALTANEVIRHYYGEFIHADSPWTYGHLGRVFVSPVMHRWHHARDVAGSGSNFATVLSIFDQAFGTYYVPGPCTVPLGVNEDVGQGLTRPLLFPFACWWKDAQNALTTRRAVAETDPT